LRFGRPRLLIVKVGRGPVLAVALGAVLTVASLADQPAWEGVWSATVNELGIWMVLGAPVTAAGAGWIASSNKRSGLEVLSAASERSVVQVRVRLVAETMYWVALGYLAALLTCGLLTARLATVWHVQALLLVTAQLSFLLLVVVAGLVVGRLLFPWFTIPLLGAGSYVLLAFLLVSGGPSLEWLSPVDNRTSIAVTVDDIVLAARGLWLSFLSVALIALWCQKKNAALVALWVTGLALSPLLLIGSADRSLDQDAARLSCTLEREHHVGVCYPKVKAFNNRAVVEDLARVESVIPALLPGTTYFVSDEAVGYSSSYDKAFDRKCSDLAIPNTTIYLSSHVFDTSSYAQVDSDQFTVSMALTLVPPSSNLSPIDDRSSADLPEGSLPEGSASEYLEQWTLLQLGVDLNETGKYYLPRVSDKYLDFASQASSIGWFNSLPSSARNDWMSTHREKIATGTVTWADFE
jgi:hypothetical protein